ncbi:uncharacterized protein LOC129768251 [Toxorhynchites rutilus septentrionalis]|uniref:uncharacterized protein LOC129768251 n=1 Tax=Toxorhynchites rutilus septentrionalis TaxID=329112 RepID=UPI00247A3C75|nr:uncharacterized protein LOC129768251 [Toxorhynchites rutilus septentrionalis]
MEAENLMQQVRELYEKLQQREERQISQLQAPCTKLDALAEQDVLTNEDQNRIIEETHQRAHRGADENYAKFKICWFLFISLLAKFIPITHTKSVRKSPIDNQREIV